MSNRIKELEEVFEFLHKERSKEVMRKEYDRLYKFISTLLAEVDISC
jgi:hypothetical protein